MTPTIAVACLQEKSVMSLEISLEGVVVTSLLYINDGTSSEAACCTSCKISNEVEIFLTLMHNKIQISTQIPAIPSETNVMMSEVLGHDCGIN